ncbi:superoxide dismutase [Escherichia coli]|uniref:Superoxide dismutase n=1 Tax=Escherichia coli TaxID=562 RepID=A0A2X1Q8E9_ECOLX|nr:superoxide dismutase [Escherichia coli]
MKRFSLAILALVVATGAQAASEKVEMNLVTSQGVGQSIGSVTITETDKGLEFSPDLKALPPGEHGFHIHCQRKLPASHQRWQSQRRGIRRRAS